MFGFSPKKSPNPEEDVPPNTNGVSTEFATLATKIHSKALRLFEEGMKAQIDQMPVLLIAVSKDQKNFKSAFLKFSDEREKKLAYAQFLLGLHSKGFDLGYMFNIAEAWLSVGKIDDPNRIRPSKDPNRIETFIIAGASKDDGFRFLKTYEIVRTPGGLVKGLTTLTTPGGAEMNDTCFNVRSAEEIEKMPETSDRTFNLWNVIHLAEPYLTSGMSFAQVTKKLTEQGIDFNSGKYFP